MAWYKNTETGVAFDIVSESTLEHVENNPVFVAIDGPEDTGVSRETETTEEVIKDKDLDSHALSSMTKKELKELAENMGLEVSGRMNVKELKSVILDAE